MSSAELRQGAVLSGLVDGTEYQYIRSRGSQWTSNGDDTKEQANRKKHGVDFRTAAKVFLDPYVIEFDDLDAAGELRFNAIGLVDGRMPLRHLHDEGRDRSYHIRERGGAA